MANAFNLTAQINLQGPTNLRETVSRIKKEFAGVNPTVKLTIDKNAEKAIVATTAKLQVMSNVIAKTNGDVRQLNVGLSSLSRSLGSVKDSTVDVSKG